MELPNGTNALLGFRDGWPDCGSVKRGIMGLTVVSVAAPPPMMPDRQTLDYNVQQSLCFEVA